VFESAGIPISDVVVYTAETDPNNLLGRPHQYIAKVTWQDTRVTPPPEPAKDLSVDNGGSIEIFPDQESARRRYEYIDEISKSSIFAEYHYLRGVVFLRLSNELTPTQADEYKQVFDSLPLE
jgi:hypothetical protein